MKTLDAQAAPAANPKRRDVLSRLMKGTCCGLLLLCATAAKAQDISPPKGHKHGQHQGRQEKENKSPAEMQRLALPDVKILNQDGQQLKFYTNLVKGKLVIINFIYTSCTDICPLLGDNFAKLQGLLGDRLGKDVYLLSISTDPETDSPAKLKVWSERFKPKTGWTFVTGEKTAMRALLVALTGSQPRRGYHTPVALLVNDDKGAWHRTYGLESPTTLIKMLDALTEMSSQAVPL